MVAPYVKMLMSCANFTDVFRGTYEYQRVAASLP